MAARIFDEQVIAEATEPLTRHETAAAVDDPLGTLPSGIETRLRAPVNLVEFAILGASVYEFERSQTLFSAYEVDPCRFESGSSRFQILNMSSPTSQTTSRTASPTVAVMPSEALHPVGIRPAVARMCVQTTKYPLNPDGDQISFTKNTSFTTGGTKAICGYDSPYYT